VRLLGWIIAGLALAALTTPAAAGKAQVTLDDRVRAIAKQEMPASGVDGLWYEGVQSVSYDDPDPDPPPQGFWDEAPPPKPPAGARDISIFYSVPTDPENDEAASALAGRLFRRAFALTPVVYRIAVVFSTPRKDESGHTDHALSMSYTIYRGTMRKIDWRSFDVRTLCSFLRKHGNSDYTYSGQELRNDDGCSMWPGTSIKDLPN
jgi:hypothetical protein